MEVTISTHNGSAVAHEHNIRNPKVVSKEPHIDTRGIHEIWIDEPVRQAYERLFGKAIADYNAKQCRDQSDVLIATTMIYARIVKSTLYMR